MKCDSIPVIRLSSEGASQLLERLPNLGSFLCRRRCHTLSASVMDSLQKPERDRYSPTFRKPWVSNGCVSLVRGILGVLVLPMAPAMANSNRFRRTSVFWPKLFLSAQFPTQLSKRSTEYYVNLGYTVSPDCRSGARSSRLRQRCA